MTFGKPWGEISPESFAQGRNAWDGPQRLDGSPRSLPDQVTRPGSKAGGLTGVTAPHWYANLIEGVVPAGVVPVQPVGLTQPATGVRNFLMFRNSGATNLLFGFGSPATLNSTLRVTPNTIVLFDTAVPQNDIWVLSDAAGGQLSYSYSTTVEN